MAPSPFQPHEPGDSFDAGKGEYWCYTPSSVTVMRGWPDPQAWRRTRRHPQWRPCRPRIEIPAGQMPADPRSSLFVRPDATEVPVPCEGIFRCSPHPYITIAHAAWAATIPQSLRDVIGTFGDRHWDMLTFLASRGPAAMDLVESNPALAFALATDWAFHRPADHHSLRALRALPRNGPEQRDILTRLGFPATDAVRDIFARVDSESLSVPALLRLRRALPAPDVARLLADAPRLNRGALYIVTDPVLRPLVTPDLLAAVGQVGPCCEGEEGCVVRGRDRANGMEIAGRLRDAVAMLHQLHPEGWDLPQLCTITDIDRLYGRLWTRVRKWDQRARLRVAFAVPPIPGAPPVRPLTGYPDAPPSIGRHDAGTSLASRPIAMPGESPPVHPSCHWLWSTLDLGSERPPPADVYARLQRILSACHILPQRN